MEILQTAGQAKSGIMGSLKSFISDAEAMLEHSTHGGSENYQKAKEKLAESLVDAKFALAQVEDVVISKAKDAAVYTAEFAKEHPWKAAAIVALAGVLVGVVIARK